MVKMDEGHGGNKPVNMATELGGVYVPPTPPPAPPRGHQSNRYHHHQESWLKP